MSTTHIQTVIAIMALIIGLVQFQWIGNASQSVDVTIARGQSVSGIAHVLAHAGVIRNAALFQFLVSVTRSQRSLKAGEYRFAPRSRITSVMTELERGGRPSVKMIRIPDGSTARDIAALLHAEVGIPEQDFLASVFHPSDTVLSAFPWLPSTVRRIGLEGYLFGDTYEILEDSRAQEVVRTMLNNFSIKALPILARSPRGYPLDLHETVTLASIVEREVGTWRDRRVVADIFLRRLRYGMALQADSTVNYATGKNVSRARLTDVRHPSPYNTYTTLGLPPGPISNPTALTLWAVIQPIHNPFWYFLTDPVGTVYYSRTFSEHQTNKQRIYGP